MPDQQSAPAAGWVGHVLAGHRIDALIGEGGMGVVYRATHLQLRRTVALKVLPPPLAADQDYRRRFEREATIAASLEHPNVVPIYDAGHANEILYLSMRFVEGEDLGAVLRREGRLDVERVCAILAPVAEALDAVHEAGLVHRDVKPGNVLIARTARPRSGEHVYLCDFGIAKAATSAANDITSAGQYIGTLQYSSPEQIEGRWLDGRSDQYGLACLVFRSLTGQVPYPRPETAGVLYAHLTAPPPRPSLHRRDLPPAVDAAVARATAKQPDRRFPSCAAFISALRDAHPAPARPRSRPMLPKTLPLPAPREPHEQPDEPTLKVERAQLLDAPAPEAVPAPPPEALQAPIETVPTPVDVRAERGTDDRSITITWAAGGAQDVEYKITRRASDDRWHVVGRTRSTCIVDGAVAPDAEIPQYGVVARLGSAVSELACSPAPQAPPQPSPQPSALHPAPDARPAAAVPAVGHLTVVTAGTLVFEWPSGITEAMVVVRHDRPPEAPDDPAATAWKITNMRYQLDGGLQLPTSIALPCHVAVASCRREGGTLVVASEFDLTVRALPSTAVSRRC